MDWTTPLKAQQTDFIQRLKSAKLLRCDEKGQHSELTVISGQRLDQLRDFCWDMVKKYKPTDPKNYFINNMKGKLGEEVVKSRLADFVTEVDYEKRVGGDGKVDFTLSSDSSIGIQVKARNGNFDKIQWSISQEEIEKNAVLVCILIQEEVSEAQAKYNLILAGFLPTNMITSTDAIGIDKLLYSGGLRSYLEACKFSQPDYYICLGNDCFTQKDYIGAISNYTKALELNPQLAKAYLTRGFARNELGNKPGAIDDYTQAIKINSNDALTYSIRGITYFELGNNKSAVKDYTQAIKINPNDALTYSVRGLAYFKLGNNKSAIADYNQAIKINPNAANSYYNRGIAQYCLEDKHEAIKDLKTAANLYKYEGKELDYEYACEQIRLLQN